MLTNLLLFAGVSLVVIVTPGPDTALTVRNALFGRRSGILTAVGSGPVSWPGRCSRPAESRRCSPLTKGR